MGWKVAAGPLHFLPSLDEWAESFGVWQGLKPAVRRAARQKPSTGHRMWANATNGVQAAAQLNFQFDRASVQYTRSGVYHQLPIYPPKAQEAV